MSHCDSENLWHEVASMKQLHDEVGAIWPDNSWTNEDSLVEGDHVAVQMTNRRLGGLSPVPNEIGLRGANSGDKPLDLVSVTLTENSTKEFEGYEFTSGAIENLNAHRMTGWATLRLR